MRFHHVIWIPLFALASLSIGQAAEVGERAPSCQAKGLDGSGPVDLASRTGKVVYIDFWASWCGPCAESFPFLDQLHTELKSKGFEVLGVNLDEDAADAQAFLRKRPVGFTLVGDPDGRCPRVYGVQAMPSSYLVDRQGVIRHVHRGFKAGDKKAIRDQILLLLGGSARTAP
jgi:thiol-disulfide isomerase/thioredoxin